MKRPPSQDYADLIGDGVVLRFDFGQYSSGYLKKAKNQLMLSLMSPSAGFQQK